MGKLLALTLVLGLAACGDDGFGMMGPKFNNGSGSAGGISSFDGPDSDDSGCKGIVIQSCAEYAATNNCTGAQQQYLCDKGIDSDKDGYVCDDYFGNGCPTP